MALITSHHGLVRLELTFIILALPAGVNANANANGNLEFTPEELIPQCKMIGDVNVFLSDPDDDDNDDDDNDDRMEAGSIVHVPLSTDKRGELEIMIAGESRRSYHHHQYHHQYQDTLVSN